MLELWDLEGNVWQWWRCKEPRSGVTMAAQAMETPSSQSQTLTAALAQAAASVSLSSSAFSLPGCTLCRGSMRPSSYRPQAFWYTCLYLLNTQLPSVDRHRNGIYWKRGKIGLLPQEKSPALWASFFLLFLLARTHACLSSHLLYTVCDRAVHTFQGQRLSRVKGGLIHTKISETTICES